jgi:hypothetical protein
MRAAGTADVRAARPLAAIRATYVDTLVAQHLAIILGIVRP